MSDQHDALVKRIARTICETQNVDGFKCTCDWCNGKRAIAQARIALAAVLAHYSNPENTMIEIRTSYDFANFPAMDTAIHKAVGRISDFSGSDFSGRELGWIITSEIEAARIEKGLRSLKLPIVRKP